MGVLRRYDDPPAAEQLLRRRQIVESLHGLMDRKPTGRRCAVICNYGR